MNELVFVQNEEVVTDSLKVAEVFDKQHRRVMQDIRELECSEKFNQHNFVQVDYVDERNRTYQKYLIKRDGLAFLVMGYTGKKAAEYKEQYIQAFNELEKRLKEPRILSEKEQLMASMKLSIEASEEIGVIKKKVVGLEERFDNELTLTHGQAVTIQHQIKKRVEHLWEEGLHGTLESKHQMYMRIHSQLKRAFQAPTYREIKRIDYNDAMAWIKAWRPL